MKFEELVDFIEKKMSMSHIYQPLLIRSLVDAGGTATLRQLALSFLNQDESQILFYQKRIKEMPLRVLKKHGVVDNDGELVFLSIEKLTFEQKARIRMLCEQRMQAYIEKRGLGIWDYRFLETDPIPDSLRYLVLMSSGGKCSLCGISKNERPLDVDHIIPRSRGGKNELANLQVLCSKCNRSKGNKDKTDFRELVPESFDHKCPFCEAENLTLVAENNSVFAIRDRFPVTTGHTLIIPHRHTTDYFSMIETERTDAEHLIRYLRNVLMSEDPTITGINIGTNAGQDAGQTVMHAHIHLIPRRYGDISDPRGGVRGVIPEKRLY